MQMPRPSEESANDGSSGSGSSANTRFIPLRPSAGNPGGSSLGSGQQNHSGFGRGSPHAIPQKDLLHETLLRLYDNALFQNPQYQLFSNPPAPTKVLDASFGTTSWAVDFARAFPLIDVVRMDATKNMEAGSDPAYPPNLSFVQGSPSDNLPFASRTFALVICRVLFIGVPEKRLSGLISEFKRVAVVGGFVEICEPYMIVQRCGPIGAALTETILQGMTMTGSNVKIAASLDALLESHDFLDVRESMRSIPINWGGPIGSTYWAYFLKTYLALKPLLTAPGSIFPAMSDQDFAKTLDRAGKEYAACRSYVNYFCAYGEVAESHKIE
ncbi:hypothetical protein DFJ73DRAFT_145028 [Zopfochytrium polystomum]|nr:hypothetical protein DFJ73DRAFT_145028 [Zopfochytrium polystomum]